MATVAPPHYRSPLSSLPAATVSSSPANSSTPSKKQDNSAAVAAGRRRLAEFKQRKAGEKGKKNSTAAVSDVRTLNVVQGEQQGQVSQQWTNTSPDTIKPVQSNGHINDVSNDIKDTSNDIKDTSNDIKDTSNDSLSSAQASSPIEVAVVSAVGGEHASTILPISDAQLTALRSVKTNPDWKPLSSLGLDKRATDTLGSHSVDAPIIRPPLASTPPISEEVNGLLLFASGHGTVEPVKNPVGGSPSLIQFSSASQGFHGILNPSSQKVKSANLVMLDTELVPNTDNKVILDHGTPEELGLPRLPKLGPEQPSSSKSIFATLVPSSEAIRTEKQADGIDSTSSSIFPHNSKAGSWGANLGKEKPYIHPVENTTFNKFPSAEINSSLTKSESSALSHISFSEVVPPKSLPLPPPISLPTMSSSFKPEPSLPRSLNSSINSGSTSDTLFSTGPTRFSLTPNTSFQNNALLRPSAPLTFQFPAPVSGFSSPHEGPVLPRPSLSEADFPRPYIRSEAVDQSRQVWPLPSAGDDFTMLEQHIEDLTQEKFSLQRGLDSARALVETLAQENSALTEDYNNQGALVNDLKAENERQQGEIHAQAVVVKKMKEERDKAVQDSNAAVERSQALAAEVIDLEEKVLRARSQVLKLEKEMESLRAEAEIRKRQISTLEKDRTNLKSLMEALQEEKGLLQTQIRKAIAGGRSGDARAPATVGSTVGRSGDAWAPATVGSSSHTKVNAATSTDDLELVALVNGIHGVGQSSQSLEHQQGLPIDPSSRTALSSNDFTEASQSVALPSESGSASQPTSKILSSFSGRGLNLGPLSAVIPQDQAATISNINNLITELADEKEALLKALRAESVGAAQLRTLNSELSQKLEVQTQRLELAVAQNMAHSSTPTEESSYALSRIGPDYIDEGDEVVDRVLTWIMQLFPNGSSRRKRL